MGLILSCGKTITKIWFPQTEAAFFAEMSKSPSVARSRNFMRYRIALGTNPITSSQYNSRVLVVSGISVTQGHGCTCRSRSLLIHPAICRPDIETVNISNVTRITIWFGARWASWYWCWCRCRWFRFHFSFLRFFILKIYSVPTYVNEN